ncbi:SMC-Scp complex subunit ScpB [Candidatus Woesearchaeota archaeon]|nr:SMC-Scp complex subunit ScpB [Candidatus Woesearchaeota archaeon]
MSQDYKNVIEALLFASGRLMDINTLLNLTGASGKQVLINNINKLRQEYTDRDSPLMIVEEKDGWKLTVREAYLPHVRKIVSETELPKTILETLAVIAWKNPILQSEVVDIRHNKAYEHISVLEELGFIRKIPEGRSYRINLTEKFFEYFDVDGTKDIRDVFRRVVNKAELSHPQEQESELVENLPDWYVQGAKFLDEEDQEKDEFGELDNEIAPEADEEKTDLGHEEFSEL